MRVYKSLQVSLSCQQSRHAFAASPQPVLLTVYNPILPSPHCSDSASLHRKNDLLPTHYPSAYNSQRPAGHYLTVYRDSKKQQTQDMHIISTSKSQQEEGKKSNAETKRYSTWSETDQNNIFKRRKEVGQVRGFMECIFSLILRCGYYESCQLQLTYPKVIWT